MGWVRSNSKQDKFWVDNAPNGESWEIYTVLEDSQTFYGEQDGPACCGGAEVSSPEEATAPTGPCC